MPAGSNDDVVMRIRLSLSSADSAEAVRLAAQTSSQINSQVVEGLNAVNEATRASYAAKTKLEQQAAKESIALAKDRVRELVAAQKLIEQAENQRIGEARKADAELQRMGRLQAQALKENAAIDKKAADEAVKAANQRSTAWRRSLEDLENFTTVARGVWDSVNFAADKFKQFATEIINVTNVVGSFKGSLDAARDATSGTVEDLELISARNRAAEMDLHLTGEEFATVAAQADNFADAVGINGKEALDKLIQGLAEGRIKTLAHAGVVIDADKAYADYAKKVGAVVEQLTDEEKRTAVVDVAMQKMTETLRTAVKEPANFATVMEQALVGAKNAVTDLFAAIGSWQPPDWFTSFFSGYDEDELRKIADPNRLDPRMKWAQGKIRELEAQREAEGNAKMRAEAQARGEYYEGGGYHGIAGRGHGWTPVIDPDSGTNKVYDLNEDYEKMARLRREGEKALAEGMLRDALSALGIDPDDPKAVDVAMGDTDALAKNLDWIKSSRSVPSMFAGYSTQETTDSEGRKHASEMDQYLKAMGRGVSDQSQDDAGKVMRRIQSQTFRPGEYAGYSTQEVSPEKVNQLKELGRSLVDVDGHKELTGPGIFERLMFGPTGAPDVLYDKMTEAQKAVFDATVSMREQFKATGEAMAGAMGQSIAAAIGENKNFKETLKETEHAVLMSISSQMWAKSLLAGGEAIWDAATGNWAGAALAAAAAEAFAAGAVATGYLARSTYTAPGSTAAASRGTSAGSGVGASRGDGGGKGDTSMTFVFNGAFLTEPDALAKLVSKSVIEAVGKNGRPPPGFVGSAG